MRAPDSVVGRFAGFVANHNRIVIVLLLILTAGVAFGIAQDQGETGQTSDNAALDGTDEFEAGNYIDSNYGDSESEDLATTDVYLITEDGSALSRASLLTAIEYQQAALSDPAVSEPLAADGVQGVPNIVATELAGEDADLETQYEAIETASNAELESAITASFSGGEDTAFFLPTTYEAGSTESDAFRMTFTFDDESAPTDAVEVLDDTAEEYEDTTLFVSGLPAFSELNQQFLVDAGWLVLPAILLVLVVILGFAYRDLTDVALGFVGTVVSLVWTAGLMGWMGLLNMQTALIVPVLIAALSIDFGFHVFMRYRENRGPDAGIRAAMSRATAAITVAFLLVAVTAAIGFLSNQFSPVPIIRDLGVAATLGVVGALIVFTTLVPALKVSADGLWERVGFDRQQTALGKGRLLRPLLESGVNAAQRGAAVVLVVALVAGLVGGVAFTDLDREAYQAADIQEDPGWQSELPGPLAYETHESAVAENFAFVQSNFQGDREGGTDGSGFTTMLVRGGDVATADAMERLAAGHEAAGEADPEVVIKQDGEVQVVSPLSVMRQVAAEDGSFAATFESADTDGDGVPETEVEAVLDALFATAPDEAGQVIERTDDGSYESMLLQVPAQQVFGSDRADVMRTIADEMAGDSAYEVTAVGSGTLNDAEVRNIVDGIVWTLLAALAGILVALAAVYRTLHGSFTLGVVTVVPIGIALGLVFAGMYLLGQPLTTLTALLVSITIGLGIDYNIHISDRFVQELERGREVIDALRAAVTGTGGALLGSAVTSGSAFSLLLVVPNPQFNSFGLIVALALGVSFVLSVFVLPSLLYLWARAGGAPAVGTAGPDPTTADD
jgi:predicted RND superfamily exporter protein